MKSLKESLLSNIEDTIKSGDIAIEDRCKLNYRLQYFGSNCQEKP